MHTSSLGLTLPLTLIVSLSLAGCGAGADCQTTGTESVASQPGILADIVVPEERNSLLPGANGVEISTSMSVADLAAFFEAQMPSKGWTLSLPVTPKPSSAVLYFEQAEKKATVHIRRPPGRDATLVQVILG